MFATQRYFRKSCCTAMALAFGLCLVLPGRLHADTIGQ